MAEPLEPQEIARRTFDVARRGYEQQSVRGFLHEVAALLERLSRSEQELRERAERAEAKLGTDQRPDETMLLEVLGEETTRVLTSAREAAAEIRGKAEEAAARIIAEATAEAAEVRGNAIRDADALLAETKRESEATLEAARTELDRRRAEAEEAAALIREEGAAAAAALREEGQADLAGARAEGEAALEAARQEGRAMVAEAQAVRERVLRDLAVRRKRARQQVEKLNAGRERLLRAYEVVRRTVGEATDELSTALTDARLAADAAARRIDEEPEPTLEQLDEEVANAGLVELPIAEHDLGHDDDGPGPFSGEVPVVTDRDERVAPATDEPAPPASDEPVPPAVTAAAAPRLVELDERRSRKRRKRGFEGLPPAELTVLQPPSDDEGVRVLAEPAVDVDAEGATADAEPAAGAETEVADASAGESGATNGGVSEPAVPAVESDAGDDEARAPDGPAQESGADDAETALPAAEAPESGAADEAAPTAEATEPPAEAAAPAEPVSAADDVFARLRAEQAADPAGAPAVEPTDAPPAELEPVAEALVPVAGEPTLDEGAPEGEPLPGPVDAASRPFAARRAALESVEKELVRRLKRGLADEQNEVLDLLRRAKPTGIDDLLPGSDEHAARWADAVTGILVDAAAAGADWSGGTPSSVADLADELARGLTAPLRERIDRSFVASDGNLDDVADRVRALYREWKGQRLTEAAAHFAAAAYARGLFDGLAPDSLVRWVVDPGAGPCPDCDDNVLAGAITKGTEFPTGNPCAPAHPGCHCLVLAAEG